MTNARKSRTPKIAMEPGVSKLLEDLAITELIRLALAGRIVFELTFFALIFRGIF